MCTGGVVDVNKDRLGRRHDSMRLVEGGMAALGDDWDQIVLH